MTQLITQGAMLIINQWKSSHKRKDLSGLLPEPPGEPLDRQAAVSTPLGNEEFAVPALVCAIAAGDPARPAHVGKGLTVGDRAAICQRNLLENTPHKSAGSSIFGNKVLLLPIP
jgi:hypothetical protein